MHFIWQEKPGFDNINMDLIVGLPGEDIRNGEYTLDEVKALEAGQPDGTFSCCEACGKTEYFPAINTRR